VDWDINVLLSQDENLGYWWSTGFGFKSLGSFIFEWCYFRKNGLSGNFCHRKGSWKPPKTTQLCWLAVTKTLDQNLIMRYQWKEDIHIFYLIPCEAKYLYHSGHTDHFYNQGPNGKWKNGEWYVHIVRGPWINISQIKGLHWFSPLQVGTVFCGHIVIYVTYLLHSKHHYDRYDPNVGRGVY